MGLLDLIGKANETFGAINKGRDERMVANARRPYLQELAKIELENARSGRDTGLSEAMMKFAEAQNAPEHFRNRNEMENLNNGLKGIELKFSPYVTQEELTQKRLNNEKTRFETENPLLGKTGAAGQIGSYLYLKNHPELENMMQEEGNLPGNVGVLNQQMSPWKKEDLQIGEEGIGKLKKLFGSGVPTTKKTSMADLLKEAMVTDLKRQSAYANLANEKVKNYGYGQLTAEQKRAWVAHAKGMGFGENEAREAFNAGKTIQDLAEEKGYNPNDLPEAIYEATNTDISRAHFRRIAQEELNILEKYTTDALAPYSRRFNNYSPKQIMEAIGGNNPDGQAKYLAARAIAPEIAGLRFKIAGGTIGVTAMEEIISSSMAKLNAFQGLISPEVFALTQKYIDTWLNEASKRANTITYNPEKAQNKNVGTKKDQAVDDPLGVL